MTRTPSRPSRGGSDYPALREEAADVTFTPRGAAGGRGRPAVDASAPPQDHAHESSVLVPQAAPGPVQAPAEQAQRAGARRGSKSSSAVVAGGTLRTQVK